MTDAIRAKTAADESWVKQLLDKHWGSSLIVSRGKMTDASLIPAYIAVRNNTPVGLLTYVRTGSDVEIITLNSEIPGMGIGSALLGYLVRSASHHGIGRIWLVTTNDNTAAISFYQKRSFTLKTVHKHAVEASRKLKPEIPLIGFNGIPIEDELEFEMHVQPAKVNPDADPTVRANLRAGLRVSVVQKQDQPTGKLTDGIIRDILTPSANHHRGIKVRLTSGIVGRVQVIHP